MLCFLISLTVFLFLYVLWWLQEEDPPPFTRVSRRSSHRASIVVMSNKGCTVAYNPHHFIPILQRTSLSTLLERSRCRSNARVILRATIGRLTINRSYYNLDSPKRNIALSSRLSAIAARKRQFGTLAM